MPSLRGERVSEFLLKVELWGWGGPVGADGLIYGINGFLLVVGMG